MTPSKGKNNASASTAGASNEYLDITLHPKYNPQTGKIETRGRKRKAVAPPLHHMTRASYTNALPKLQNCMNVITTEFGSMKKFLLAWTANDNPDIKKLRDKFMGKGVQLVIDEWLPLMNQDVLDNSRVVETVVSRCEKEVAWLVDMKNSGPLRYVSGKEDKTKGLVLYGGLCYPFLIEYPEYQLTLWQGCALHWRI